MHNSVRYPGTQIHTHTLIRTCIQDRAALTDFDVEDGPTSHAYIYICTGTQISGIYQLHEPVTVACEQFHSPRR